MSSFEVLLSFHPDTPPATTPVGCLRGSSKAVVAALLDLADMFMWCINSHCEDGEVGEDSGDIGVGDEEGEGGGDPRGESGGEGVR